MALFSRHDNESVFYYKSNFIYIEMAVKQAIFVTEGKKGAIFRMRVKKYFYLFFRLNNSQGSSLNPLRYYKHRNIKQVILLKEKKNDIWPKNWVNI